MQAVISSGLQEYVIHEDRAKWDYKIIYTPVENSEMIIFIIIKIIIKTPELKMEFLMNNHLIAWELKWTIIRK